MIQVEWTVNIVRVEKQNCVELVYNQIRNLILTGEWKEGEKLMSEQKLGELFGVSRAVVREALQRLRSEKLVITHQGTGSFVSNPKNYEAAVSDSNWTSSIVDITDKQYEDFIDFRCCIEFRAIELAVKHAEKSDLDKVGDALSRMEMHLNDINRFSEEDYAFHKAIADCSKNSFFSMAMESVKGLIIQTFREMNKLNDSVNWGIEMHRMVYMKLCARDAKGAIALLVKNNEYNKARLGQFTNQPDNN